MKRPWCWSVGVLSISKQTQSRQVVNILELCSQSQFSDIDVESPQYCRCDLPLGNATCTSFLRYHNSTSYFIDFLSDLEPVATSSVISQGARVQDGGQEERQVSTHIR